ncbi:MAG: hydantoinase/oxoprolinase family protein, partial [Gemmatimonadota bacterium]
GPRSAGAEPGPICYGRGGTRVTVTDAHVWLGRLPSHAFLGGEASLDRGAIEGPLAELARALDSTLADAAEGVLDVADTAMEGALRVISVERGHDPSDFALVPFGGAAGLHAVELAERLGVARLLVPPDPGVLSAFGMLVSPVRKDLSRTILAGPDESERIAAAYAELEGEARAAMDAEGVSDGVRIRRLADVRYAGQSFELRVPASDWARTFHDAHEARYGFARPEAAAELVTARVEATGPATATPVRRAGAEGAAGANASPVRARAVRFRGQAVEARVVGREALAPATVLEGPAVVHEYSATLWLPPGWSARTLDSGSLMVERG